MTDWPVLDVAIGLTLVYSAVSLLCSSINEAIASLTGRRAKFLEKWLKSVLANPRGGDAQLEANLQSFYDHPLIKPLVRESPWRGKDRRPSYIPASTFVSALVNRVPKGETVTAVNIETILKVLEEGSPAKDAVSAIQREVGGDLVKLRAHLEEWYDQSMDRVSGWYKRRVQIILAVLGLLCASFLNIDTINIADTLWSQPNVRTAVVAQASAQQTQAPADLKATADAVNSLGTLGVPVGWRFRDGDPRDWPHSGKAKGVKLIGVVITTFALLLGAPFWFDLLGRLTSLRGAGPAPKKKAAANPKPG